MAKYYYTSESEDGPRNHSAFSEGKIFKPTYGEIYEFWNEIYKGKKNKKDEREGYGTKEWNFDTKGNWHFEDWAKNEFWHYSKKEYDYDNKLNPDRKLSGNKIIFQCEWKDDFPHGEGKFLLNGKVFCEGILKGGSLHGKCKIKMSKFTQLFAGFFSNELVGYEFKHQEHPLVDYSEIQSDKHLADFEGDYLYGQMNGYGKLIGKNGVSYEGEWRNNLPHGNGTKKYKDGRVEIGEFGILNQGSLLVTEYVDDFIGHFLYGSRTFADGTSESVDKRTVYQKTKSTIKDIIK